MKKTMFLLYPFILFAETSFITPMEYASQLYKNPRGIGCQHCHGENGEGKLIARYIHKNEKKSFEGPAINTLTYTDFYKSLNKRISGMPRYFLTQKEVEALYLYINEKNKKSEDDK